MYATRQTFSDTLQLFTRVDLPLRAVSANVIIYRDGHLELVRVWIGLLGLLELEDLARTKCEVLLCAAGQYAGGTSVVGTGIKRWDRAKGTDD